MQEFLKSMFCSMDSQNSLFLLNVNVSLLRHSHRFTAIWDIKQSNYHNQTGRQDSDYQPLSDSQNGSVCVQNLVCS